jgi:hypothetical protein
MIGRLEARSLPPGVKIGEILVSIICLLPLRFKDMHGCGTRYSAIARIMYTMMWCLDCASSLPSSSAACSLLG